MKRQVKFVNIFALFVLSFWGGSLFAVDAKPSAKNDAEEIVKKAFDRSMMGVSSGTATLRMVITSPQGDKKDRTLTMKTRRGSDQQLQYLIKFETPAEIKGTSFLVLERKGQLPDQKIYVPATKVVRRVAAGNASSSFFGSDFLYADLLPYPTENKNEVDLKKLPDAKIGGQDANVVEITPKSKEAPYGKLIVYVQKDKMVTVQIEFFDRSMKALKTMRVRKLKTIDDKLVPVDIEMKNVQANSKTELFIDNIDSKAKLGANDFTEEAMQR